MSQPSARLGYYVISLGIALQVLGLAGDSWTRDPNSANDAFLALTNPSHVFLVLGMGMTIFGTFLGMLGLAQSMAPEAEREPRLLPALPLVLLVGVSLGSAAFAYQASSSSSDAELAPPLVVAQPGPNDCPTGTFWHPDMNHCMIPSATGDAPAPICPLGYAWSDGDARCEPLSVTSDPSNTPPVCPDGTFWHQPMGHCMSVGAAYGGVVICPSDYFWHEAMGHCMALGTEPDPTPGTAPSCPSGTFWHEPMGHCMALAVEPAPTPGATPECPDGTFWHEVMGHCMPLLPTPTPTPAPSQTPQPTAEPVVTTTPTPSCPDGYFWHPSMGHCMSNTCPPGLELNPDTLYCELPGTPPPTETPTAEATPTPTPGITPTPLPSCPDGYFWHPLMGHCMSYDCPPGLVLDPVTGYCVLPSGTEAALFGRR